MVSSNFSIARRVLPICLYRAPRLYCVFASFRDQFLHLKELVDGLLDLAGLLVLDPEIEIGVRQRAVDPLRSDDLLHALFALAGPQQGKAVIEVLTGRARIQVESFLELLDRLLRGPRRLVERLAEISRLLQCNLLGTAPLGLGRCEHPPRGAASQRQGENPHHSHLSTHPWTHCLWLSLSVDSNAHERRAADLNGSNESDTASVRLPHCNHPMRSSKSDAVVLPRSHSDGDVPCIEADRIGVTSKNLASAASVATAHGGWAPAAVGRHAQLIGASASLTGSSGEDRNSVRRPHGPAIEPSGSAMPLVGQRRFVPVPESRPLPDRRAWPGDGTSARQSSLGCAPGADGGRLHAQQGPGYRQALVLLRRSRGTASGVRCRPQVLESVSLEQSGYAEEQSGYAEPAGAVSRVAALDVPRAATLQAHCHADSRAADSQCTRRVLRIDHRDGRPCRPDLQGPRVSRAARERGIVFRVRRQRRG